MRTLSINASQQELDLMISEIDTNNDGQIQFEEFVAVMSRKVQASYTAEDVRNAFKVSDDRARRWFFPFPACLAASPPLLRA
jgi:calmodulin